MRVLSGLLLPVTAAGASPDMVRRASDLYRRTDYTGKKYLMSGDYKKAVEFFDDLSDFYLNAPGFLGGGMEKAEAAAEAHLRRAGGSKD
jgi:hypothetical protein